MKIDFKDFWGEKRVVFKRGDIVKVIKRIDDNEGPGWTRDMNKTIGEVGEVVKVEKHILVRFINDVSWYYLPISLKHVNKKGD